MFAKVTLALATVCATSTSYAVDLVIPWQDSLGVRETPITPAPLTGQFDPAKFEASGVVWDPSTSAIVLVDDQGWVYSDGGMPGKGKANKIGGDLEAITSSGDGHLYAGREGGGPGEYGVCVDKKPEIVELKAADLSETTFSWKLDELPAKCANGMEGLTWVPDAGAQHPYGASSSGGVFYASSQRDGKIYVFDVNRKIPGSKPKLLNPGGFTPFAGQQDISDIYYDPSQKILFVLFDAANRLT